MRGLLKKIKANLDGTAVNLSPREMWRFGKWFAPQGWLPTGTLCPEDGNVMYRRGDEYACSGELIARWRSETSNQESKP